jgi:hypothetical protein
VASAGTGGNNFPEVVPIFRILGRDDDRRGEQGRHVCTDQATSISLGADTVSSSYGGSLR